MVPADGTGTSRDSQIERAAPGAIPARLEETIRAARQYAEAARSPNTLKAYDSDVRDFQTYCNVELGGASPRPATPETVALYITDMAQNEPLGRGLATATIQRRLASISAWHKRAGHPSPTDESLVRETMKGIRRMKGSRQKKAAPPHRRRSPARAWLDPRPRSENGSGIPRGRQGPGAALDRVRRRLPLRGDLGACGRRPGALRGPWARCRGQALEDGFRRRGRGGRYPVRGPRGYVPDHGPGEMACILGKGRRRCVVLPNRPPRQPQRGRAIGGWD